MTRKSKISAKTRNEVLARDNYICRACGFGGSANFAPFLDCDHSIAESNGGQNTVENMQCLCKACNGFKGKNNYQFAVRAATQPEEVWAANQKVVAGAFSTINSSIRARRLKLIC